MQRAERIKQVPPYLFATIDKKKREAIERGVDIISFGIGDPDQPTPKQIVDKMCEAVKASKNHRYPDYEGSLEFRSAVSAWYKKRFGVDLKPADEVMTLIGSKEGIAHIFLAFVDPGDYTLIPDPAYPVYKLGTMFANGVAHYMPLKKENQFLPDFAAIPTEVAQKAKMMFLNYPNNPTAAVADLKFFAEAVAFCKQFDIILCHDNAYSEMAFDGYLPPSILQVPGAKDIAVEFGSLSKPFNMTGWRMGFAVGCAEIIAGLGIIKTNIDSGQFTAVQDAGIEALLNIDPAFIPEMNALYQARRDILIDGLNSLGWKLEKTQATFYVWAPVPQGYDSMSFCAEMLDKCGIIVVPGVGYGPNGEGYVRFALTLDEARIREALERMKKNLTLS